MKLQTLLRLVIVVLFVIILRKQINYYKVRSRLRAIRNLEHLSLQEILTGVLAGFANIKTWQDFESILPAERLIDITNTAAVRRMNRVSGQGDEVGFKNYVYQFHESPDHYGVLDIDFLFDRLVNVRIQIIINKKSLVDDFLKNAKAFIEKEAAVELTKDYLPDSTFTYAGPMGEDLIIGMNKLPNSISIAITDKEIALKM